VEAKLSINSLVCGLPCGKVRGRACAKARQPAGCETHVGMAPQRCSFAVSSHVLDAEADEELLLSEELQLRTYSAV
jgi:hypothetical protein